MSNRYNTLYISALKKEHIAKGFDRLAPVYDGLSKFVFGNALQQAQEYLLSSLIASDSVLILGGGSGDLLKSLLRQHPQIMVDYIDISPKMIELAKEKTQNPSTVNFIVGTEQNIPNQNYTVVITNFYLDLFENHTLEHIVEKIKTHVSPNAHWLVADFVSEKTWHKTMLWVMYRFFRITTGIEPSRLPDWPSALKKTGMQEVNTKKFYRGFIKSSIYKFATSLQG